MGLISGVGRRYWASYRIQTAIVSLVMGMGKSHIPYNGDWKVSWASKRAYDGETRPYTRYREPS